MEQTGNPEVEIGHAENVTVADTVTQKNFVFEHEDGGSANGQDGEEEVHILRGGQTSGKVCKTCCLHGPKKKKRVQKVIVTNQYRVVKVHVRLPADGKISNEDLARNFARLEWDGDVPENCHTAFKINLKEKTSQLLEEVKVAIHDEARIDKLVKLVSELFEKFQTQLMLIGQGSLQFVLQHQSAEAAERVVASPDLQQKIQAVLMDFLPRWVPAGQEHWTVGRYRLSQQEFSLKSADPVSLILHTEETEVSDADFARESVAEQSSTLKELLNMVAEVRNMMGEFSKPPPQPAASEEQVIASSQQPDRGTSQKAETLDSSSWNLGKLTKFPHHKGGLQPTSSLLSSVSQTALVAPAIIESQPPSFYQGQKGDGTKSRHASSTADSPTGSSEKPSLRKSAEDSDYTGRAWSREEPSEFIDLSPSIREKPDVPVSKKTVSQHSHQDSKSDAETVDDNKQGDNDERGDHKLSDASPKKKSRESITLQAEQLLNWVNVKSKASQSSDPEIQRMMKQVEHSLEEEEEPAPKARALDTILVLDTSDSVVSTHLDTLKTAVHTFVDGIEDIVDNMNLEENLAVVQMGDHAWVRQHLTNDYSRVRDVVDEMTPESEEMRTGGRTPIFQAMMVCLGAIEGRGGVVNVAGCHRVRPRIIFFTDGRPTDEATEHGLDVQSNVNEVKFALVQLISEFASKKHKTTPTPIFWVPVGKDPDRPFLNSLAALSGGKVVEPENVYELCRYYKVQETIGCVYKMVRKHTDVYESEHQMKSVVEALAGNLEEDEKKVIMEEVRKKEKEPDSESRDADDFDNVFEDRELVANNALLPLGTRVVRGKNWKWNNQDSEGPGTVIQHRKKRDGWLHVMWDNGSHNAYRYGESGFYDVEKVEDRPRLLDGTESGLIDVGVTVRRGNDWKDGEEDGNGEGVVIRKRKDGKVKVRWENGNIGKYRFGADGKFEVQVSDPRDLAAQSASAEPAGAEAEQLQGAVGGYDPIDGPERTVWFWRDLHTSEWFLYEDDVQEKLNQAFTRRHDGSCVITRDKIIRRVLFKTNQEKTVDRGVMHEVRMKRMGENKYRRIQGKGSRQKES